MSIVGLLGLLNIQHQRVAVELNEMIVKKDRYEQTFLKDGDSVEVVSFMGGGQIPSSIRWLRIPVIRP